MTAYRRYSRRSVVGGAVLLTAGCLGDDSDETGAQDDADATDDGDGTADSDIETTVTVPGDLPVDPSEDDYLDRSGEAVVEVRTREGLDEEPTYVFDPPFIAVDPGTTIRWVNDDGVFHTVTSTPSLDDLGDGDLFDVEIEDRGDETEWTQEDSGIQHYYCRPHTQFMWGSIAFLDGGEFPTVDEEPADDSDDEETDDEFDDVDLTDVPSELPTDPDDADFHDARDADEVEIITREGRDGEPSFVFDPPFVRVTADTTVRWVNRDGVFHTVTSTNSLENRSGGGDTFDETISAPGDTFEWTPTETGRQDYYCSPHAGFMFGSIDVE